jgi:flagellar hook-length control protein FliK
VVKSPDAKNKTVEAREAKVTTEEKTDKKTAAIPAATDNKIAVKSNTVVRADHADTQAVKKDKNPKSADSSEKSATSARSAVKFSEDVDMKTDTKVADAKRIRKQKTELKESPEKDNKTENVLNQPAPVKEETHIHRDNAGNEVEIVVHIKDDGGAQLIRHEQNSTSAPQSVNDMSRYLARELREGLSLNIVRQAQMSLREAGQATVKLTLYPPSLGNVKVRLEMAENRVTGKITVESSEALSAFEAEIAGLVQAFRESGFESASLETSLASQDTGPDAEDIADGIKSLAAGYRAARYDSGFAAEARATQIFAFFHGDKRVNYLI